MYQQHHFKVRHLLKDSKDETTPCGLQVGGGGVKTSVHVWYPSYLEPQRCIVLCHFKGLMQALAVTYVWINESAFLKRHRKLPAYSHQQEFVLIQTQHWVSFRRPRTPQGNVHQDCDICCSLLKLLVCKLCSTGSYKEKLHVLTEWLHVFHGILFTKDNRWTF